MSTSDRAAFIDAAQRGNLVPLVRRLMSDQLTPVLAYRRLVSPDARTAPSFLLESVESGENVGRYSFLGAQPAMEIIARGRDVTITDHTRNHTRHLSNHDDPLRIPGQLIESYKVVIPEPSPGLALPDAFTGGWVGYAGYDTVRFLEKEKLPFESAPADDRYLPDIHFALYRKVVVFDHVSKTLYAIHFIAIDEHPSVDAAYDAGMRELDELIDRLETHHAPLPAPTIDLDLSRHPDVAADSSASNMTRPVFEDAVSMAKEYIAAGDIFQVVLSQRFERTTTADPFDLYRALRIVNPSPYQIYLQADGAILVAASPEILCRVHNATVTNRPLAGTRRRGVTDEEDQTLQQELLADTKERAEHVMLVDLGRNDLGRVCAVGSITLERIMQIERYSHVMHISSTITGRLREGLNAWDALRATLPVGTVSGAPKVRAMQIIDELEPTRRGPYAGGIGAIDFTGNMDIALALRTMVVPIESPTAAGEPAEATTGETSGGWVVHLQAGAGIVADSDPAREYEETVNKAAALGRAIDLAERASGQK